MQTIPSHGRVGAIVGVHYLSQVSWPVSLFVFAPLPDHSHYGLVWSLNQPISLWVVRHGLQFPHAEDLAHFIDDTAHEVSTPVTQEPGWDSKDQDVTLIQELGNGFGCLIRGHICQYMLHEVVLEYQDVSDFRWLVQLQGCLYAGKIYMSRDLEEWWPQWDVKEPWTSHPHVVSNAHRSWWIATSDCIIPSHQKHSCNRDRVLSWPWCPASLWHPFRVVTQCDLWDYEEQKIFILAFGCWGQV